MIMSAVDLLEAINPGNEPEIYWTQRDIAEFVPDEIERIKHDFNNQKYKELVHDLRKQRKYDTETGIRYALIGESGDSKESAVVHFNPFGNDMTDNMLLRASFLQKSFKKLGITDENGDSLPVLSLSAPSDLSTIKLDESQHETLKNGVIGPVTKEYLKVVKSLKIGRMAVIGFSFGASLATSSARLSQFQDLDVTHLVAGEPPNVVNRKKAALLKSFTSEAKYLKDDVKAGGIKAFETAHRYENPAIYTYKLLRQAKINYYLGFILAKNTLGEELVRVAFNGIPATLASGTKSTVCSPEDLRINIFPTRSNGMIGKVHEVTIENAHHTWGDNIPLLATFYAYGLTRQKTKF